MNCECCKTLLSKDDTTIGCGTCGKVFKNTCIGLNKSEVKKINSDSGLSWSCKDCRSFRTDFLDLRSLIIALQEEVRALKAVSAAPAPTTTETLIRSEEIIQEVAERERRRSNIIVYGITESSSNSTDERVSTDIASLQNIFQFIGANVPADIKPIRLGKFDPTKRTSKRPIKVSFPSPDTVSRILNKSHRRSHTFSK